jgi:hypothetical protein
MGKLVFHELLVLKIRRLMQAFSMSQTVSLRGLHALLDPPSIIEGPDWVHGLTISLSRTSKWAASSMVMTKQWCFLDMYIARFLVSRICRSCNCISSEDFSCDRRPIRFFEPYSLRRVLSHALRIS